MNERNPATVIVRDAQEGDLEAMVRFNCALAFESEGKQLDANVVRAGVRRGMAAGHLCRYFVVEVAGEVVGQTMVTFELTDWRDGINYWIQSVYVDQAWRGRGLFRALFQHVEGILAADPAGRCLRLYVERDNTQAISTYEKLGMHRESYYIYEKSVVR